MNLVICFQSTTWKRIFLSLFFVVMHLWKMKKKKNSLSTSAKFQFQENIFNFMPEIGWKKCVVLKWYTQTYFQITKAHCIEWYTSNILSTNDSKCIINSTNLTRLPVVIPYFLFHNHKPTDLVLHILLVTKKCAKNRPSNKSGKFRSTGKKMVGLDFYRVRLEWFLMKKA